MLSSQNGFCRAAAYLALLVVFAFGAPQIHSQAAAPASTSTAAHAFDVVSIKPDPSGGGGMNFDQPPIGSHWSATNVTIKWMIEMAFDIKDYQLSGQPGWVNAKRYDVEADIGQADVSRIRVLSPDNQIGELRAMCCRF